MTMIITKRLYANVSKVPNKNKEIVVVKKYWTNVTEVCLKGEKDKISNIIKNQKLYLLIVNFFKDKDNYWN